MEDNPRIKLDEALVALQKSFSRLSRTTGKAQDNNKEQDEAMALIVGNVEFEIELNTEFDAEHIYIDDSGTVQLRLKGEIATDIRIDKDKEEVK